MICRQLRGIAIVVLCLGASARAESIDPSLGRIEITAALPENGPYVGEPFALHVRSSVRALVTRDKIEQPAMTDFDWQQFGIDVSTDEMVNGFRTPVVERVVMLTPLKAGALTIAPFLRRVTIQTKEGERVETTFVSNSLTIEARAHDGIGRDSDWWLPAKALRLADAWEPAPDKIRFGETARRTLTLEAVGLTADRLPPPPVMRAPGIISFLGPMERETIVTDEGPIARATYRWSVRPVSVAPSTAPAIHIPWFDTNARIMRDATIGEREVAFLDAARSAPSSSATRTPALLSFWPLTAGAASFVWSSAALYLIMTWKSRRSSGRTKRYPFFGRHERFGVAAQKRTMKGGETE